MTVCLSVPSVPVCDAVSLCLSVCLSDATLPLCFSASLPAACRHASAQVSGQVSGRVRVQPGYESSASGWCWVVLGAWCVCGGAVDRLRVCACGSCQRPGQSHSKAGKESQSQLRRRKGACPKTELPHQRERQCYSANRYCSASTSHEQDAGPTEKKTYCIGCVLRALVFCN